MEVSALKHSGLPALRGPTPLLRLQADERLVALVRRGQQAAFEALVGRYEARLLAFCRHMLGSREDAEDVLQEVFAAAFNAMLADERAINVRPWLYRIARNRSLNHLRRAAPIGVDSMDVHFADAGESTGEKVLKRESFRQLIGDVQELAETQRTALLLREIDNLSYEQIAEAMETTVPSVKSLLVRARISLAEAAEARKLSCDEVRFELGEVAEGLARITPPARRHLRDCNRCRDFRAQLRANNRVMAALFPVGPLLLLRKLALAKLGSTASAGGAHVAGAGGATATATAAAGAAGAGGAGAGLVTAGAGALATKAVAGLAAAALVTAGAVEAGRVSTRAVHHRTGTHASATVAAPVEARYSGPLVVRSVAQRPSAIRALPHHNKHAALARRHARKVAATIAPDTPTPAQTRVTSPAKPVAPKPTTETKTDTTALPTQPTPQPTPQPLASPAPPPADTQTSPAAPPPDTTTQPQSPPPGGAPGSSPSGSGSGTSGSGTGTSPSSGSGSGSSGTAGSSSSGSGSSGSGSSGSSPSSDPNGSGGSSGSGSGSGSGRP